MADHPHARLVELMTATDSLLPKNQISRWYQLADAFRRSEVMAAGDRREFLEMAGTMIGPSPALAELRKRIGEDRADEARIRTTKKPKPPKTVAK